MKQAFFPKAALAAAIFAASAGAQAAMQFTVDEAPFGGAGEVTGKVYNGRFDEAITLTSATTWESLGVARFFTLLDEPVGGSPVSFLGPGQNYGLYAEFELDGDLVGNDFIGTSGAINLWLDDDADTTFTLPATGIGGLGSVAFANTGDDLLLGTADLSGLTVLGIPGIGGFIDAIFDDIALTLDGESYFVEPNPFHIRTTVDGDFDQFPDPLFPDPANPTAFLNGDISAIFVPEPGTVALMGIGLLGAGASMRRRNAA